MNKATLNLIKQWEGCKLKPYLDSVKIATIGIGTIKYPNGKKVTMQDPPITVEQAEEYLMDHLVGNCISVSDLVKVQLNDNEFGALVSFVYNLGAGAFASSTLLKKLNKGDKPGAADEFLKWDHAGGKRLLGLTKRRQAERALFLHPDVSQAGQS